MKDRKTRRLSGRLVGILAATVSSFLIIALFLGILEGGVLEAIERESVDLALAGGVITETAYLPIVKRGPSGELYQTPITYPVGIFNNYTIKDPGRNRSFPILIRHPIGAPMPLPVVVFSHGGGPSNKGHLKYEEWGTRLAQAGYVTIHIAHVFPNSLGEHCGALGIPAGECELEDFMVEVADGGTLASPQYHKPRDVSAVLDELDALEVATGAQFDRDRLAVAGHSGGSHAVMQLAGAAIDFSPSITGQIYRDARFVAYVANSPQGIDNLGFTTSSWDNITVPVMVETGLADVGASVPDPIIRLDPFLHMPGPDKYQLYIDDPGALHIVFSLNELDGPATRPLTELEQYVLSSGLAFLDAHVRHLPGAQAWLRSGSIEIWSDHIATIEYKG